MSTFWYLLTGSTSPAGHSLFTRITDCAHLPISLRDLLQSVGQDIYVQLASAILPETVYSVDMKDTSSAGMYLNSALALIAGCSRGTQRACLQIHDGVPDP